MLGLLVVVVTQAPPVPHPRDVLGFTPGDDYRIADFPQMREYFRRLDDASDRVRVEVAGKSTDGRDILVAVISSEANLARLDHYKDIARRLALVRGVSPGEARALAREGKAIVWIDNGLHADEVAHAQHALLLAYQMATDESEEARRIRDNVILVLLPSVNPDGLDLVAHWYRATVNTPYRDSPMPWLFNTYSGYDNNRDFFMQTQAETRVVNRLLYREWLPEIVYNQHQGFPPTRIFVPPFPDPANPHIDPGVLRGVELVGAAIQHRFEREGKDGVISRYGFDIWYDGSLRTTAYFHNMIGILTETTHDTPSPFDYDSSQFPERFGNGWPTRTPSINYPRPWRGGTLRFRDPIDYMLTASTAVLDVAARYREELLQGIYDIGARQIALGNTQPPFAYVIPPPAEQHDPPVAAQLVQVLLSGAVEVHRATAAFQADGRSFAAGSYVILSAQPFRPFVRDLLEPQHYPDLRRRPDEPPTGPYDNAGWTLSYQMGVTAIAVARPFEARLERVDTLAPTAGTVTGDARYGYAINPRTNNTFVAINRLLAGGYSIGRASAALAPDLPAGAVVVRRRPGVDSVMRRFAGELGLDVRGLAAAPGSSVAPLAAPRIAVYKSWTVEWVDNWTAGEGWTRWVLDQHEVHYTSITNADVRAGKLGARFDVVVIPSQAVGDIVGGYRAGRRQFGAPHQNLPPPEYQGGIEATGVAALKAFVVEGGTLVLVDQACDLAPELGVPVRNALADLGATQFFGPGSIVRLRVAPDDPLTYGMLRDAAAYFRKSRAFAFDSGAARSVARYAERDLLLSGWLVGAERLAGKPAVVEARLGGGRVVLLGFPAFFRGQPLGTFKLFLNALYLGPR